MQGRRTIAQVGLTFVFFSACFVGCDCGHPALDCIPGQSTGTDNQSGSVAGGAPAALDPGMHQPFAEATRQEPPVDWQRPPDLTLTGKSVGKLYTQVIGIWDTVRFTSAASKPIAYRATLDTELGSIVMDLRQDLAPNHVRNFVALSLAHYYDGLVFERTIHARSEEQPAVEVEIIEGGCPLGTGDVGYGSLGYWLKTEFNKEPFDIGTVAACHGEDPDSAACRFYITLTKAPFLDGHFTVFAKVSSGLDVARRVFSLPVRNDPEYPESDRPEKPVVIRTVTIETLEAGGDWKRLSPRNQ